MMFRAPAPLAQALESNAARALLPTEFRTRVLQAIDPQLRARAVFTAGGTNAQYVGELRDVTQEVLSGRLSRAEGRARLRSVLDSLDYRPLPEEQGTITDLSSERRINLQIDTNTAQMQALGRTLQQDQPVIRDAFPAWELVRFFGPSDPANQRNWRARWERAGGEFFDGRMIARKDDPVWERLGSSELFSDGLDQPYPPYAFNSGMDRVDIGRAEAVRLGVVTDDDEIAPASPPVNAGLRLAVDLAGDDALAHAAIENLASQGIVATLVDGVLRFGGAST